MKNQVIKVKSVKHGKKVIKYFKNLGVDTGVLLGNLPGMYYGFFDEIFNYSSTSEQSKVIKLPKKNKDRVMWVWDDSGLITSKFKRVVFMKKNGRYLTWSGCETLKDAKKELNITFWDNAEKL